MSGPAFDPDPGPGGEPSGEPTPRDGAFVSSAEPAEQAKRNLDAASDWIDPFPPVRLLDLYDDALPQVYGYLVSRCGDRALAEDLTAESFVAAVAALRKLNPPDVCIPWLIGVARHKLVDHWRRVEREQRGLRLVHDEDGDVDDPWEDVLDEVRSRDTLAVVGPHHRAALTLRYLDGLPVAEVAECLGRSVHATEALLVRARRAFRRAYTEGEGE